MGQNAARNRERQWRVDFSMRPGCGGTAVYSWKLADPWEYQQPDDGLSSGDSSLNY
jgi:hypothetical protein